MGEVPARVNRPRLPAGAQVGRAGSQARKSAAPACGRASRPRLLAGAQAGRAGAQARKSAMP
jgi:hypothetical protein